MPGSTLPPEFNSCCRDKLPDNPFPSRKAQISRDIPALHQLSGATEPSSDVVMSEQEQTLPATQHSASLPLITDTGAKQQGVWLIFTEMNSNEEIHAA